jgi:F420-dependent methylenetetrahydromethanopterin dehydrogenase
LGHSDTRLNRRIAIPFGFSRVGQKIAVQLADQARRLDLKADAELRHGHIAQTERLSRRAAEMREAAP